MASACPSGHSGGDFVFVLLCLWVFGGLCKDVGWWLVVGGRECGLNVVVFFSVGDGRTTIQWRCVHFVASVVWFFSAWVSTGKCHCGDVVQHSCVAIGGYIE